MFSTDYWVVHTEWPPERRHVADARAFVADRLTDEGLTDLLPTSVLIVSELATNAVVHARTWFRVTIVREGDCLVLEVHDDSDREAVRAAKDVTSLGGRGLELVVALSSTWGVTAHPGGGKSVWARLPVA